MTLPAALAGNVSRETQEDLARYVALLEKWNPRLNLISRADIQHVWIRHITDSLQVYRQADRTWARWVDMGAGGGLPGLVVAICAKGDNPDASVVLMESDQRKAVFLRTVIRELSLPADVIAARIEAAVPQSADVISARALARLTRLLALSEPHIGDDTLCLFPKGRSWADEVEEARADWSFRLDPVPSTTHEDGVILRITEARRA